MQNAVFYLPYLEKRCIIIFIRGAFPLRQTGGPGGDGLNTCPALSAAQPHIWPPALLCGTCYKKYSLNETTPIVQGLFGHGMAASDSCSSHKNK